MGASRASGSLPWTTLYTVFAATIGAPFLVGNLMVVLGLGDPVGALTEAIAGEGRGWRVSLPILGLLVAGDAALAAWLRRQARVLYDLLKAVGDAVREGLSIEEALLKETADRRGAYPRLLREALQGAEARPLSEELRARAGSVGDPGVVETLHLVADALEGEGDVGPVLRWLGEHQQALLQQEVVFERKLSGTLAMMRGMGLFAGPLLFAILAAKVDAEVGVSASQLRAGHLFFFFSALMMAALDGLVYGRWMRAVPKVPLFVGIVRQLQGW